MYNYNYLKLICSEIESIFNIQDFLTFKNLHPKKTK